MLEDQHNKINNMSTNIIRIKRRLAVDGAAAPTTSQIVNAELAFSEFDETLYYGKGGDETGAAEVIKIGGAGFINSTVSAVSAGIHTRLQTIEDKSVSSGTGSEGDYVMLGANGKIADTYLPALAITTTHVVTAFADASSLTVEEGDVLVVNDESGLLSKSFIYNAAGQWIELKTPLDAKIDALSADLQGAIDSLNTNGVGALQTDLSELSSAYVTLTGANNISVLGSIASQDSDDVSITGGSVSVEALTVTAGTAEFVNINTSGNVTIGGTFGATGAATLGSSLSVAGAVDMDSTLDVTGAATLGSSLDVTGAVDLSSTLDVTGAATLGSSLDVTGAVDLSSTLDVTGAATLGSSLDVTGAVDLSSTLDVTGAATLGSSLSVVGAVVMDSTLDVTGAATLDSSLDVAGAVDLSSTLDVSGAVTMTSTLNVTGPVTISGNLSGASVYNLTGYNCTFDAGSF